MTLSVRSVLLSIAALAVVVLISTQGVASASLASYRGSWIHREQGIASTIDLRADGSLELTHIPRAVVALYGMPHFNESLDWRDTIDATGTWSIIGGEIWLRVETGVVSGFPVSTGGMPWQPTLTIPYGSADRGTVLEFVRE